MVIKKKRLQNPHEKTPVKVSQEPKASDCRSANSKRPRTWRVRSKFRRGFVFVGDKLNSSHLGTCKESLQMGALYKPWVPDLGWWVYHSLSLFISKQMGVDRPAQHISSMGLVYLQNCQSYHSPMDCLGIACLVGWLVSLVETVKQYHSWLPGFISETHLKHPIPTTQKKLATLQRQAAKNHSSAPRTSYP